MEQQGSHSGFPHIRQMPSLLFCNFRVEGSELSLRTAVREADVGVCTAVEWVRAVPFEVRFPGTNVRAVLGRLRVG